MKKNFMRAGIAAFIAGILLFAGCEQLVAPSLSPAAKEGNVVITIEEGEGAKTLLPVLNFSKYDVTFTKDGDTEPSLGPVEFEFGSKTHSVKLDAGKWSVELRGYVNMSLGGMEEDDYVAVEVHKTFTVAGSGIINVPIEITGGKISEGTTGKFSYRVNLPQYEQYEKIAEAKLTLYKYPDILNATDDASRNAARQEEIDLLEDSQYTSTSYGTVELPSGYYALLLEIKKKDDPDNLRRIAKVEIVHINDYLTTSTDDAYTFKFDPTVTGVSVSPSNIPLAPGGEQEFSARVLGDNEPPQSVTWTIVETGKNAGTTITTAGLLKVAQAETLSSLTIKATSTYDPLIYGEARVNISSEGLKGEITVTGLEAYNGLEFGGASLLESNVFSEAGQSEIYGGGYGERIAEGKITVPLLTDADGMAKPWEATGSYYIGFMMVTETPPFMEVYISKEKHDFGSMPTASLTLNDFTEITKFSITADELVKMMTGGEYSFADAFPDGTSLDMFLSMGGTSYEELEQAGLPLYKDEALLNKFAGSDYVSSTTKFWSNVPFWMMDMPDGPSIAAITGTISLTDLPSADQIGNIQLNVSAWDSTTENGFWSETDSYSLSDISGGKTLNWEIPITANDLYEDMDEVELYGTQFSANYYLRVELKSGGSYEINLNPDTQKWINIPNEGYEFDAGGFGTVSVAYVTLSGTVNVSYNDASVPELNVNIMRVVRGEEGNINRTYYLGNAYLKAPPVNGSAWKALVPVNSDWEAMIRVGGSNPYSGSSGNDDRLFSVEYPLGKLSKGEGKSGIVIDIGNINPNAITVNNPPPGTYDVDLYQGFSPGGGLGMPIVSAKNQSGRYVSTTGWEISNNWSYQVVIRSGNELRYTSEPCYFINGAAYVDWEKMTRVDNVSIEIVPEEVEVQKGSDQVFSAEVSGLSGNTQYSILWTIDEFGSPEIPTSETRISSAANGIGVLYVGTDETLSILTVKARVSVPGSPAMAFDTATVYVIGGGEDDPGDSDDVSVTINIVSPEDIELDWDGVDSGASVPVVSTNFTAKAPEAFDNYGWVLDGKPVADASSYTVNIAGLSNGQHTLAFVAFKDGVPYSRDILFRVSK